MQELLEWMEYIEDTRQQRKVRHRPCVLQLHTEMLCLHRPENREDNTSRCRTDGYVYPYV